MYGYLADGVVVFHVLYVAYVLVGQLAIVVAAPFKWAWARNPWFRFTHLAAIGIVAVEAIMGWRCPLSTLEENLRIMGGGTFDSSQSFMGRLTHNLLFIDGMPESFFTVLHLSMTVLVVQGLLMYPPRWFRIGGPKSEPPMPVGMLQY
jgi:hypothetical protein